jgi:hypothetical protein
VTLYGVGRRGLNPGPDEDLGKCLHWLCCAHDQLGAHLVLSHATIILTFSLPAPPSQREDSDSKSHLDVPKFHPPIDSRVFSSLFLECGREGRLSGSSLHWAAAVTILFGRTMGGRRRKWRKQEEERRPQTRKAREKRKVSLQVITALQH